MIDRQIKGGTVHDRAALDHDIDSLGVPDVRQRIGRQQDDIRPVSTPRWPRADANSRTLEARDSRRVQHRQVVTCEAAVERFALAWQLSKRYNEARGIGRILVPRAAFNAMFCTRPVAPT